MGTTQDASALNGQTLDTKYFYSVGSASVSSSGINGVNTYSGSVAVSGPANISGLVTDTSSGGNGAFSLTASNGSVTNYVVLGSSSDSQNLVVQAAGSSNYYVIVDSGTQPTSSIAFNSANGYLSPTCFLTGTMILTTRGEIAVEHLTTNDLVVTVDGEARPIRWIGLRSYDCGTYIKPDDVLPIRVARNAIAPGIPNRDTFLSNGHALAFEDDGGVMISVHELTNGTTIAQMHATMVTYWHVELDRHDVILANALPAESYKDCGTRHLFQSMDNRSTVHDAVHDAGLRFRRIMYDATVRAVQARLACGGHSAAALAA